LLPSFPVPRAKNTLVAFIADDKVAPNQPSSRITGNVAIKACPESVWTVDSRVWRRVQLGASHVFKIEMVLTP